MYKLKLIHVETLEIRVIDTKASKGWWSEGNGSCDCNRELEFHHPESDVCTSNRYLIIDVGKHVTDDITYSITIIDEYNTYYTQYIIDDVMGRLDVIMERDEKLKLLLE